MKIAPRCVKIPLANLVDLVLNPANAFQTVSRTGDEYTHSSFRGTMSEENAGSWEGGARGRRAGGALAPGRAAAKAPTGLLNLLWRSISV